MKTAYEDKRLKNFFKGTGVVLQKGNSAGNVLVFKNTNTGEEIHLVCESNMGVAAGIPCIFVDSAEGHAGINGTPTRPVGQYRRKLIARGEFERADAALVTYKHEVELLQRSCWHRHHVSGTKGGLGLQVD